MPRPRKFAIRFTLKRTLWYGPVAPREWRTAMDGAARQSKRDENAKRRKLNLFVEPEAMMKGFLVPRQGH